MKTKLTLSLRKLYVIGCISTVFMITSSCDKLEKLEPQSYADKFEGKIAGEWTVDSIKYTSFSISKR